MVGGARVEASASTRSPLLRGLGGWHRNPDRLLRPSASAPSQRHGRRVSVQAQQVMPSFRQQPAAQADPALRRTLTRQPAPALAPPRPVQPAAAARPVFLPRNLIMNKQACAVLPNARGSAACPALSACYTVVFFKCFVPSNTFLCRLGDCENIRKAARVRRAALR